MKTVLIFSFACFMLISAVFLAGCSGKEKTAYVELGKVYGDFELKKELESKLANVQQARKTILDSMKVQLEFFANNINAMSVAKDKDKIEQQAREFEAKKQQYYEMEKNFREDNEKLTSQYQEQVWKQLNQYVKDYGKENGYLYIYGAGGNGFLMYADEANDITEKVKKYVNEHYKGKK